MKINKVYVVPTGEIYVASCEEGILEFLSLGDYGKDVNLNQHKTVPNGLPLLPLFKKWVITISTQYGCSMGCSFCDVPKVGPGINISKSNLIKQVKIVLSLHQEIKKTNRLNIHFARMGEPTWNPNVIDSAIEFEGTSITGNHFVHPVLSTMMPKNNKWLRSRIIAWMKVKNNVYNGNAGLQLSINSTDELERSKMFNNNACTLEQISELMSGIKPKGRKITLNFAIANYTIDPKFLIKLFSPDDYIVKLTPMHKTNTAINNNIKTKGDYTTSEPYEEIEYKLKKEGFDTLVFIASRDEDEGLITCGNAILSGSIPKCNYSIYEK